MSLEQREDDSGPLESHVLSVSNSKPTTNDVGALSETCFEDAIVEGSEYDSASRRHATILCEYIEKLEASHSQGPTTATVPVHDISVQNLLLQQGQLIHHLRAMISVSLHIHFCKDPSN